MPTKKPGWRPQQSQSKACGPVKKVLVATAKSSPSSLGCAAPKKLPIGMRSAFVEKYIGESAGQGNK
jgi:hypothetical protein